MTDEEKQRLAAAVPDLFNPTHEIREAFDRHQAEIAAQAQEHVWAVSGPFDTIVTCARCGIWFLDVVSGKCPERVM